MRNDRGANDWFLEILTSPRTVERILRQMNESGVLGRFVPEFGKIVALMQFNMYHHYTVDEHLIRAVGVMAEIANGGLRTELPLTHELLPSLNDTRLLYVALFLHDIAKGRPEDHSIAGAEVARRFCPRLGLDAAETDTVAWLIEYHSTMSEIAQARDLQDLRKLPGLCRYRPVAAAAGAADDPDRLRHPRGRAGRVDRSAPAAPLALLRHRAAALGRPFARHPVRPHRRRRADLERARSLPWPKDELAT